MIRWALRRAIGKIERELEHRRQVWSRPHPWELSRTAFATPTYEMPIGWPTLSMRCLRPAMR
jgi:hypothetical protein